MSRAIWAWRCPLLAGHSARTFSGICRRGGGRRACRTPILDRCFRRCSPERVHPATCPRLSQAFLSSPHPHRFVAAFGPSPLPGSGGSVVSPGGLDAEKLSSSPCRDHCCTQTPCTLRPALPSALQRSHGGLAGAGGGHGTCSRAWRVTARSRLGLWAGSLCSVSCLSAATSHPSIQLPGARAWGAGAEVARDGCAAPGLGSEVLSSLFLCSHCTTSPPTPGSIMRTSKCEYSWAAVQTRGGWGDRLSGLRDLGWDVGSQFPKGLPGRARCQRKGQEGAVWARTLGHVGLRLGSEQAWGREGQRSGPVKHWDADLQLGRAAEDTAQPRRHQGRGL